MKVEKCRRGSHVVNTDADYQLSSFPCALPALSDEERRGFVSRYCPESACTPGAQELVSLEPSVTERSPCLHLSDPQSHA